MPATPEEAAALNQAIADGNAIVCYARCQPCMFGQCYDPPQHHGWADDDDREHARNTGQPEPTGRCGCPCAITEEK